MPQIITISETPIKIKADYQPISDYWFFEVSLFNTESNVLLNEPNKCYCDIPSVVHTCLVTVQKMKEG